MEYFVYGRDRPGAFELKMSLNDDHWSFMDGYGELLVARGPTLTGDDDEAESTGSLHIVDLADAEAARTFAYEEPYYRAGVFESVLLCRFHNVLGRTMWDFTEAVDGYGRFLVITMDESDPAPVRSKHMIVYGELLAPRLRGAARPGGHRRGAGPGSRGDAAARQRRRPHGGSSLALRRQTRSALLASGTKVSPVSSDLCLAVERQCACHERAIGGGRSRPLHATSVLDCHGLGARALQAMTTLENLARARVRYALDVSNHVPSTWAGCCAGSGTRMRGSGPQCH